MSEEKTWITATIPEKEILRNWRNLSMLQKAQFFATEGVVPLVELCIKDGRINRQQSLELLSVAEAVFDFGYGPNGIMIKGVAGPKRSDS